MLFAVTVSTRLENLLTKLSSIGKAKWQMILSLLMLTHISHAATLNSASSIDQLKNIYSIVQDQKGFIWMAGQRGLIRYDGNSLVHYSASSNQWHIPYTWINAISVTNDNQLVVSTEDGNIHLFNTRTGENSKLSINLDTSSIYKQLLAGNDIYFYMPGSRLLYRYNLETKKAQIITKGITVEALVKTKTGVFFYTETAVYKIEDLLVSKIYEGELTSVVTDDDHLYVATKTSLTKLQDSNLVKTKSIAQEIKHLIQANNKERFFLLFEDNSIGYINKNLEDLPSPYKGHQQKSVRKIFHDSSNALWLYGNQGVHKLSPNLIEDNPRYFDVHINAIGLTKIKNEIVIASYGAGLHSYDDKSLFKEHFDQANDQLNASAKLILDVVSDNHIIYLATFDGIWLYDTSINAYQKLRFEGDNQVFIKIRKQGTKLYLGTDANGILVYDLATSSITDKLSDKSALSSLEVLDIISVNNSLWIATASGLDIYYPGSKTSKAAIQTNGAKVTSLEYLNGKIYAFTKGSGVYILNSEGETLSHIANGIDFSNSTIIDNRILGSSRSGLFWIEPNDESYVVIEGTQEYGFTSQAIVKDNVAYVGHYGGVITFPLTNNQEMDAPIQIAKTTVSGQSWIDNKPINISSSNDVITLELASLDYRKGIKKRFQYKINDGLWQKIHGDQLTLTGLSSGSYNIAIKGTNSLAQWSTQQAFVEINVAYPWYWTPHIRVIYLVLFICLAAFASWLLYLRGKSISHIHQLLSSEIKIKGRTATKVSKQLEQALELIQDIRTRESNELNKALLDSSVSIVSEAIEELKDESTGKEPDNLYGKTLDVAVPYLSSFLKTKYRANLVPQISVNVEDISYELQADIYKIIYEALMSAILNGSGRNFKLTLQMFKEKLWLTIHDDTKSLANFNDRINFDMAMYYIRQIGNKHNASINAFEEADESSQLIVSFPTLK